MFLMRLAAVLMAALFTAGCGQLGAPASPSSVPATVANEGVAALDGTPGSEYAISGVTGTTLVGAVLTISNTKGTIQTEITADTTFREAHANQFIPVDPCRDLAVTYNAAVAAGDSAGILAGLVSFANSSCHGRISVGQSTSPVDPCRSFRPLPTF